MQVLPSETERTCCNASPLTAMHHTTLPLHLRLQCRGSWVCKMWVNEAPAHTMRYCHQQCSRQNYASKVPPFVMSAVASLTRSAISINLSGRYSAELSASWQNNSVKGSEVLPCTLAIRDRARLLQCTRSTSYYRLACSVQCHLRIRAGTAEAFAYG